MSLNEAIVLQQVHYWTEHNKKAHANLRDGHYWVYNSYQGWREQFPWWSESTVKRIFSSLEARGFLIAANYNRMKMDRTKWYRVNYDALPGILPLCQNDPMESVIVTRPVPETTPETTASTKLYNVHNGSSSEDDDRVRFSFEPWIVSFINWYKELYKAYYGREHPRLKSEQLERIHDTLKWFANDWGIETSDELETMARSFFERVQGSDHNLNHFATEGILAVRFYDSGLYA